MASAEKLKSETSTERINPKSDDILARRLDASFERTFVPPPRATLSEWARENYRLSPESSADTGHFRPWGFQIGWMDAITDPRIARVTVIKAARTGYTKTINAAVGYYIHQDPSPIMVVQPRVDDAADYSKREIAPMLRDSPPLADLTRAVKSKDPDFTTRSKQFPNGAALLLRGANSPNEFRRETIRVLAFDEVDSYPASTAEGDPIDLGEQRTTSFWNRKVIQGSTPTIKGASRIETAWGESDQRLYHVPCPHCGEEQVLEFGADKPHGLRWPKDDDGTPRPEDAYYVCVNGCVIDETYKKGMIERGRWIAQKPENAGHAGFHISALYSLFYNARWGVIAREFLERKDDPARLQTFVNTTLGETWEPPAEQDIDEHALMARRETYPAEVPDGVALLTAGVDTQDDRLEIEVVGWGHDEESWSIDNQVLLGDPDEGDVWDQLDEIRLRRWQRADGREMTIDAMCVDTGGHRTQAAYRYAVPRISKNVWPIKGRGRRQGANAANRQLVFQGRPKRAVHKTQQSPFLVDVDTAKDVVVPRLMKEPPGPVSCHFPAERDRTYFDQLTAEKPVAQWVGGRKVWRWDKRAGRSNEALDCRVYAYAALCALQNAGWRLNQIAAARGATRPEDRGPMQSPANGSPAQAAAEPAQPAPSAQPSPTPQPKRAVKRKRRRRQVMMG